MSRLSPKVAIVVALAIVMVLSVPLALSTSSTSTHRVALETTPDAPGSLSAFSTGMPASVAIGQPSLTGRPWVTANQSAFLPDPEYPAISPNGTVWVIDYPANRVLGFLPPYHTGENASFVIGQSNFLGTFPGTSSVNLTGAGAVAVDALGDLWVADTGNNRLLEFVPPFRNGMAASLVIGQTTFTGSYPGTSDVNLSYPISLSFDALGNMWVADTDNNRVLEFTPPFSTGMAASVVVGQRTMTGANPGTTEVNLTFPYQAEMSNNILWVADTGNNRVLGYSAPIRDGEPAVLVLGQQLFTSSTATGPAAMVTPESVSTDASGNLWVSDSGNNRVLEFSPPFNDFENATIAIGQVNLDSFGSADTPTTLHLPLGAFVSPAGDLWVADAANSRLLEYIPSLFPVHVSATGLPAGTHWSVNVGGTAESGTGSLVFQEANGSYPLVVVPVAGYRADPSFEFVSVNGTAVAVTISFTATGPNPYSVGMAATVELGQSNFNSAVYYSTATANEVSYGDYAAAFDSSGDLWVAEVSFNRVVEFKPPFTNDMAGAVVLGQSTFGGTASGSGAANLSFPDGIAFDPAGDLFVADYDNNRVLEYSPPFTSGMDASVVLGQTSFTGTAYGHGAGNLSGPSDLTYFDGALWVADYANNRVVDFKAPITTGEGASLVLGQSYFGGYFSGLSATNLSRPGDMGFDSAGNLWVADTGNNRAVRYDAPLSSGEAASLVVGQPNMTTGFSTYPSSLVEPDGLWVDGHGNLWVADSADNRVLEYLAAPSITTNETASEVIGQGNLTTNGANTTATGLDFPSDVLMDPHGNLWVVDAFNSRVLGYVPPEYSLNFTESGLPSGTSWGVGVNGTAASGTTASVSVAEENGTFSWTASSVGGYVASPSGGTATINGQGSAVAVTFTPFTYAVTFTESGLPTGTSWSITVGGTAHTSTGTTIVVQEPNGTYAYTVGAVAGYTASVSSGNVLVSAGSASVTVTFSTTSSSTSSSGFPLTDVLLIVVVLVVIGAIAAVLLTRRRKGGAASRTGPAPMAPWSEGPAPPPGASGGSPPPPPAS